MKKTTQEQIRIIMNSPNTNQAENAGILFKKVMEVPDSLLDKLIKLLSETSNISFCDYNQRLTNNEVPEAIKYDLAKAITQLYHGEKMMLEAKELYDKVFGEYSIPKQMPELILEDNKDRLIDTESTLIRRNYISSGMEFRCLFKQGYIQINQLMAEDLKQVLICGDVLSIGQKKFLRIVK